MGAYSRKKSFQKKTDSFTSRYMNGESKSFNDAPSTDSGAPIPTVSIPFGEENGGLISSIKKLLGKGDSDTEWISNPAHPDNNGESFDNPLYDEEEAQSAALPPVTPVKTEEQKIADGHKHARELSDAVIRSKRKFGLITIKDGMFADVKKDVADLNQLLDAPYPTDEDKRQRQLYAILAQYDKTIGTMQGYITHIREKNGGQSSSGKARLELVEQLLAQSIQDRNYFTACAQEVESNSSIVISSWDDMLANARVIDLTAKDAQLTTVGGGASLLTKRTTSDGKSEFIKPEEKTLTRETTGADLFQIVMRLSPAVNQTISELKGHLLQEPASEAHSMESVNEKIIGFFGTILTGFRSGLRNKRIDESQEDYDAAMEQEIRNSLAEYISAYPQYASIYQFFATDSEHISKLLVIDDVIRKKNNESIVASDNPYISKGSIMSDRNVSTSIMADRLGLSDIVAKSRTVLIKTPTGEVMKANAMDEAKGQRMKDVTEEISQLEKEGIKTDGDSKTRPLKISLIYSPDALIKMSDLLVFDIICGQTDRHHENFFVTVTKNPPDENGEATWIITDVQAIDNDMSFGALSYDEILRWNGASHMRSLHKTENLPRRNEKGEPVKDEDGDVIWDTKTTKNISCMSRKTYDRIMSYSESMAFLDQRHIRNESEIHALTDRLRAVKEELTEMVQSGEIMLVGDDEEQKQKAYEKAKNDMQEDVGYYFKKQYLR
jgi:hypothetical protein